MTTKTVFFNLPLLIALSCLACTPGIRLNTMGARDSEVAGTYTMILYGCNYPDDLHTIAFLDKEGDSYSFDPYTPAFNYRVVKGVEPKDALAVARRFVSCNTSFNNSQLSRIVAPDGATLGYEVRPLYHPFTYGVDDVLYTDYRLKGDKVVITVSIVPSVKRMLEGDGVRVREK